MEQLKLYDIENRLIEVGDIVLQPLFSDLIKRQVLRFTAKSIVLSSAFVRSQYYRSLKYRDSGADISKHDDKQNLSGYSIPKLYILEKNAPIPEVLQKFI